MGKYIVGFLILVIFVFFGVTLFRTATRGGDDNKSDTITNTVPVKALPDYAASDAGVQITIHGPITGDETHRAIRIKVSRDSRELDILRGYNGFAISTRSYDNDQAAYDVFLRAINGLGFTASKKGLVEDPFSVCPEGNHYFYELVDTGNTDTDVSLWSASCGLQFGNFAGGPGPTLRSLFRQQIPDYKELTKDPTLAGLQT